ncbi:MAG: sensor histidine kinase, partial [Flavobacteriales bacterium]
MSSFAYYDLDELELANQNSLNALILFRELNNKTRMAQSYLTLARVNNKKNEFKIAIEYLDSAISIFDKSGNKAVINNALLTKSEIYFRKKDYKKAIKIAKKVESDPSVMADQKVNALELLYLINKAMNNPNASLDYLEETKNIQDSLSQLERDKYMQSVDSEIDAKNKLKSLEKENEINDLELKQSRYLTWALIGLSILLLLIAIISFMYYRQNKLKSEREKIKLEQESIQLEQKLLRTQMNPHFIFNSLNSVNSFIAKKDEKSANKYLAEFSKLMREVLECSQEDFIPLSKEIELLKRYLKLEHFRFNSDFDYAFEVDERIVLDNYQIPPMLLQPFVENAIWHGLRYKEDKGILNVKFEQEPDFLRIVITDDGIGRTHSIESKTSNQKKMKSTGIKNVENRLEIIKSVFKKELSIDIQDLDKTNKSGTKVELKLY